MSVLMGNIIDNNGPFHRPGVRPGQSNVHSQSPTGADSADPLTTHRSGPNAGAHQHQGHVSFSDSVAILQRLHSQIEAEPVVSSEKVIATRASIDNGSYQIDHLHIATKLIAMDKELP